MTAPRLTPLRAANLTGAALLTVFLAGCGEENTFAPPPPAKVTVQSPLVQDQEIYIEVPGNIEAAKVVEVRARVRGFLEDIKFEPGGKVGAGDELFEIEDTPYVAARQAADAALAKAKAEKDIAQNTLDKREDAGQGVSRLSVDEARAQLAQAEAAILAAEAEITRTQNDVDYCLIEAEMSGRISESEVDIGNVVGNNEATLLATIVQDDEMHVYFELNERRLIPILGTGERKASKPESLRLILADGSEYKHRAIPEFGGVQIDRDTGTMRIRAVVPNPEPKQLIDGFFCRVGIPFTSPNAVMVPTVSLQQDLAGYFVMTVDPDNKVVRINVEVGPRVTVDDVQMRVVTKNLDGSEKIIVGGLQQAREGATVAPSEAAPPEAEKPTPAENPAEPAPQSASE